MEVIAENLKKVAKIMSFDREMRAEEHYWRIHKEIAELHKIKGADVGKPDDPLANLRASESYGVEPWVHCVIQCDENLRRIQAFLRCGELRDKDCRVENAMLDLANYAMLGLALYREGSSNECIDKKSGSEPCCG
jgi:hypothetical protein